MSADPGHPALRARIAEALANVLVSEAHEAIGRMLGLAGTTVTRRGDDPRVWGLIDGLDLALQHPPLADALVTYVRGEERTIGEAVRAIGALITELQRHGQVVSAMAGALSDGRIDATEARALLDLIHARRIDEDRDVIPALEACLTLPQSRR